MIVPEFVCLNPELRNVLPRTLIDDWGNGTVEAVDAPVVTRHKYKTIN
jgi:hypothetical protein